MSINLPLEKLSQWQQIAFSAAIIERMLPNYKMFSEVCEFGDAKVLSNQLDLVWQWLDKKNQVKINYEAQLIKLEEQVPDPEAFDSFGVFPAVDVCMSILSLLQGMQDKECEGAYNVSLLSQNSVSYYCELELSQVDESEPPSDESIDEHPLMVWEVATQNELFEFIQANPGTTTSHIIEGYASPEQRTTFAELALTEHLITEGHLEAVQTLINQLEQQNTQQALEALIAKSKTTELSDDEKTQLRQLLHRGQH